MGAALVCDHRSSKMRAWVVIFQAASQSRPSWSMSRRMSSATAMVGCVSFIWKQALLGSPLMSLCLLCSTAWLSVAAGRTQVSELVTRR